MMPGSAETLPAGFRLTTTSGHSRRLPPEGESPCLGTLWSSAGSLCVVTCLLFPPWRPLRSAPRGAGRQSRRHVFGLVSRSAVTPPVGVLGSLARRVSFLCLLPPLHVGSAVTPPCSLWSLPPSRVSDIQPTRQR